MTIINVHLTPRRALVASNTQGVYPDGSTNYMSKIFAFPHANAVMSGRGQIGLVADAFMQCMGAATDLDGMAPIMSASAAKGMAVLGAHAKRADVKVAIETEIALAGWSASKGRMVCHYCRVSSDGACESMELPKMLTWDERFGVEPNEATNHAEMAALSKLQAKNGEKVWPGMGWLGDLTLCEITPESITFTAVKDFWK